MPETDFVTDRAYMAGRVKRYHTWAVHHEQTVGEHCWQLARIYEVIFGDMDQHIEQYIRHHDTAEVAVGDPPFPVKSKDPALKQAYDRLEVEALKNLQVDLPCITALDKIRVKVCDLLEMTEFGMVEREMGNCLAVPIVHRTSAVALRLAAEHLPPDEHRAVVLYLEAAWKRHEFILRESSLNHNYGSKE